MNYVEVGDLLACNVGQTDTLWLITGVQEVRSGDHVYSLLEVGEDNTIEQTWIQIQKYYLRMP